MKNDSRDSHVSIDELRKMALKFRDDRNWAKHHTPKNLAISIAIESAELLENFQWGNYSKKDKQSAQDELADIMIYALYLSDALEVDLAEQVEKKLKKASAKYPVSMFNKKSDKAEDYWNVKLKHRKAKSK